MYDGTVYNTDNLPVFSLLHTPYCSAAGRGVIVMVNLNQL